MFGVSLIDCFSVKFCSNYYALTYPKTTLEVEIVNDKFLPALVVFAAKCDRIMQNPDEFAPSVNTCWESFKSGLIPDISLKMRRRILLKADLLSTKDCTGCGKCVSHCPGNVIDLGDGKALFNRMSDCYSCFNCI